jgi:hypothetical protein
MQLKEMIVFTFCFAISIVVINTLGIFPHITPLDGEPKEGEEGFFNKTLNATVASTTGSNGISEIPTDENGGMISADDVSGLTMGIEMFLGTLMIFKSLLVVLVFPCIWLVGIGVPAYLAWALQVVISLVEIFGLLQFISGRSTKTFD